eukprot:TRINITY_DN113_c0_g1::TRINITY_DN113_c0_g1_i1::g.14376::m.14376 TRINITY_DN113_c0_g1::TRINITY_DN113_c0_g1_i1::g.14376  ORF type:complete len:219 (+),score=53.85,sp/P18489/SYB_DROME/40.40/5e-17,Synaptobrevin/PF00957.16/2.1e-30,Longin/PF13774.1/5.4e-11,YjgP_YjgQ/PF03739.9/0.0042,Mt_ATP-synt_D/PF05873.7/0.019,NPV_P10/PF05531.7/0.061,COG2/PF06148.6/0.095,DUF3753/PF12575.3/1.6e+03,DUF3753/PF12575.3/0.082,TPR_MLP1_2/PF07926.7/1.4 TRINITY_DN113_c0_g1_i1:60-716(+)
MTRGNVRFVFIGTITDKKSLGSHVNTFDGVLPSAKYDKITSMCLNSPRVTKNSKLTLADREEGTIHFRTDDEFLYLVITAPEYPQRTAFKLLEDLRSEFLRANKSAKSSIMSGIAQKYDDLAAVDKVAKVQAQVDEVKGVMQENIETMLKTQDNLDDLQTKTDDLRIGAKSFQRQAKELKRSQWWKNMKLNLIIICIVLVIIGVILAIVLPKAMPKKD